MNNQIKYIILLTLFSFTIIQVYNKKASYEIDNYLTDGETIVIKEVLWNNSDYVRIDTSDYIKKSDYELLSKSAIIRSFNVSKFDISDFFDIINHKDEYMNDNILSYFGSFEGI